MAYRRERRCGPGTRGSTCRAGGPSGSPYEFPVWRVHGRPWSYELRMKFNDAYRIVGIYTERVLKGE